MCVNFIMNSDNDDFSVSLRNQRIDSSAAVMAEVSAAAGLRPPREMVPETVSAATRIQAVFRGRIDRGRYAEELQKQFALDEEERERVRIAQVASGEVLLRT